MTKSDKSQIREPYSCSFSRKFIENLRYFKRTNPTRNVDQEMEEHMSTLIPDRNNDE